MDDKTKNNRPKIWIMFLILGLLLIFSFIIASVLTGFSDENIGYNTAIININGAISSEEDSGIFSQGVVSSTEIIKEIEKAKNDPNVKAIIFAINSPGGSPVATDEISEEIKTLEGSNITTVAWIREIGTSGAYWVASATDHIIANRMSITGSIGVYGSYLELSGLINRFNITYRKLVSGEYKDTGTPYRTLSSQEESMLQEKLDKLHVIFIDAVAENRNMSQEDVKKLATGEFFLGIEAMDNGLIDELGGKAEAILYIEQQQNITVKAKEFVKDKTFIETLLEAMNKNSFYVGQGIASYMLKENTIKITT